MAKLQNSVFLRNKKGQSVVEYILLLAVLSSLGYAVYNNRRFKDFVGGNKGLFVAIRKGMEYSYRYGRPLNADADYDKGMEFEYTNNTHDTYYDSKTGASRFFTGATSYGKPK